MKIGFSQTLKARLSALQTASWRGFHLRLVVPAEMDVETAYHRELRRERVRLEWFAGPKTDTLITRVAAIADEMVSHHVQTQEIPSIYDFDPEIRMPTMKRIGRPIPMTPKPETPPDHPSLRGYNPDLPREDIPWRGGIPPWLDDQAA